MKTKEAELKTKKAQPKKQNAKKTKTSRAETFSTEAPQAGRWPQERNVLFRPDRLQYVKKLLPDRGCVFCLSAESKVSFETLCLYKSKHSQILVNKFPYNSGHILVLPLRHCGSLLDLSAGEFQDLHQTLRMAMEAVEKVYSPNGINLGMNHGKVSGAGIPDHLHYHLVPRWAGDLNFFPLIAETKVVVETLETTYNRLLAFFSKKS